MATMASSSRIVGCVLVVLGALVLLTQTDAEPTAGSVEAGAGTGGAELRDPYGSFIIGGHTAKPLAPGVRVPLNLTLTNPHRYPLSVGRLTVDVVKVSAPRADRRHQCTLYDFTVDQAASHLSIRLAPHTSTSLRRKGLDRSRWPHLGMRNRPVNQDGCKGASLDLAYRGSPMLVRG